MNVSVLGGKYVLAVSGGVDSMVLLDLLVRNPGVELIVAHFNHNIRKDSSKDEELVKTAAAVYQLPFESDYAEPGKLASEESARDARYSFLKRIQARYKAEAIITAHHQDDVIETAMINLIRGTNRAGLSSIINNQQVLRPLLGVPKTEITKYATKNLLQWNEDKTNREAIYLRNYLRLKILRTLSQAQRQKIIYNIDKVAKINNKIDDELATLSHLVGVTDINRHLFSSLPNHIGNELLAYNLKKIRIHDFDSKTINRLSIAIRTSRAKTTQPVKNNVALELAGDSAQFVTP
jgi:tRNA(Ile)-lysidine synthetase-like protein